MKYTILIPSHRPELAKLTQTSLAPLNVTHFDGTNYPSFSKLINDCIVACPTEIIIICSDKVRPTPRHVEKLLSKLAEGFCFVGPYHFAFFGFTKQLIRTIGFFDERYVGGGWEDWDFILRMREAKLGFYMTKEIPYVWMNSSWHNEQSKPFFIQKWGPYDQEKKVRLLSEERYPYDLGPPVPVAFLEGKHTVKS